MFNPSCFTCFIWISSFQKKTKDTNCYHDDKNSSAWLPALCGTCFQNKTLQYINFNIAEEVGKSIELWMCASVWSAARGIRNLSSIILSPFVVVTLLSSLKYYMPHAMLFYIRTNSKLFEFVHFILAKWQMCLLNRIRQINRGQLIVRQFNCFLPKKTKRRQKSLNWFWIADRDLTINLFANVCYSLAKRSRTESRVSSPIIGRLIVITISWLWKWS